MTRASLTFRLSLAGLRIRPLSCIFDLSATIGPSGWSSCIWPIEDSSAETSLKLSACRLRTLTFAGTVSIVTVSPCRESPYSCAYDSPDFESVKGWVQMYTAFVAQKRPDSPCTAEDTVNPFVLVLLSRPLRVRSANSRNSSGIPACLAALCTDA
jgi:hypothetical protein